jgi:hypothetical protein
MDAVSGATGFCLASLLAKSASFGAAAFDIVGQIFH